MANITINALPSASTIDAVNDLLPIYTNSGAATQAINRNTFLSLSSNPVGVNDVQTLANKTLTNPTINGGTLSGTFSGTYTFTGTVTLPSSVVTLTGSQTLTNKTLTSPTVNNPSITNAAISADSYQGYTATNSGSIYGINVASSVITSPLSASGGATITGGLTVDSLTVSGTAGGNGWTPIGQTLTYTGNNGNKEFTVTAPANITTSVQAGMKLQIPRGVTPPTQSMNFVSSSNQYATKSSPTGITFTGNFSIEAWIYITGLPPNVNGSSILDHDNSTSTGSGWGFQLNNNNQLQTYYRNASGTTAFASNQSVPLNQWVHVATTVNASGSTGAMYINGVSVPITVSSTGATTVVQPSTNIDIAFSTGSLSKYFNGFISEVRLWSLAQTQANIQANMAISLTGSESNLIGLWQGNGNFNDKTSNANNLTATNGAIATQASNPYSATEYGVITKAVYSGGITTLTVFTGNSNTIPNQTLGTSYYSLQKTPYGFPSAKSNWILKTYILNQYLFTPTSSTWYNLNSNQLSVPSGQWNLSYNVIGRVAVNTATNGYTNTLWGLSVVSAAAPSIAEQECATYMAHDFVNGGPDIITQSLQSDTFSVNLSNQTIYYLNSQFTSILSFYANQSGYLTNKPLVIKAECVYI